MTENPYAKPLDLTPENERVLSLAVHLVGIPFEFFGPLIGYLMFKGKGQLIDHHAKESLNFGLTMGLSLLILIVSIVGLLVIWVVPTFWLIFRIVAGIKAFQGEFYRYPLCIRFIK
jgi:uncharacterized Tic20 family protein